MVHRKSPTWLSHKPMYEIVDYDYIDGHYRKRSDVHSLSLGKAQWSKDFIPSVKVWRKSNNRWSRQSEETTLTRALDMAMLVVKVLGMEKNNISPECDNSPLGTIKVTNTTLYSKFITDFKSYIAKNERDIDSHIQMLSKAIEEYNK